ncbi:MAG: N-acetylmuramoyl-L-alanine amidase [Clostridia bacterium]|nr:N-acetylmuramoyl-L-alanine amidase [Clostridia bacterium]MDY5555444.1 N-acetylmuramoyl-L-alanine amidase [Blautia sp.]
MSNKKSLLCFVLGLTLAVSVPGNGFIVKGAQNSAKTEKHIIVLDPGHGGRESGAYAVHGGRVYKEEEINWKISNYTMKELEKNKNIEVHLTKKHKETKNIVDRVLTAKKYHADLLVSQHINDCESSSPHGVSVLISRGTYRPEIAAKERRFGQFAIEELEKVGLQRRFAADGGMEYRMSENGSKYPNGKPRDYYGIVAQSVEQNFPGVIIEHAFISNPSDAARFLSSDAQLKRLAQADAAAIVKYCKYYPKQSTDNTTNKIPNGWNKIKNQYYYYQDGKLQKNKLLKIKDKLYYVDNKGVRVSSKAVEYKNSIYYFGKDGCAIKNQKIFTPQGDIYYADKNGKCYHNGLKEITENGIKHTYYFQKNGKAYTGWLTLNNNKYYFYKGTSSKSGTRAENVKLTSAKKIVSEFNEKGVCVKQYPLQL